MAKNTELMKAKISETRGRSVIADVSHEVGRKLASSSNRTISQLVGKGRRLWHGASTSASTRTVLPGGAQYDRGTRLAEVEALAAKGSSPSVEDEKAVASILL